MAKDVYRLNVKVSYIHENWYMCSLLIGLLEEVAKAVAAQLEAKVMDALTAFHKLNGSVDGWRSNVSDHVVLVYTPVLG